NRYLVNRRLGLPTAPPDIAIRRRPCPRRDGGGPPRPHAGGHAAPQAPPPPPPAGRRGARAARPERRAPAALPRPPRRLLGRIRPARERRPGSTEAARRVDCAQRAGPGFGPPRAAAG